jgi:spore germination protein GerM
VIAIGCVLIAAAVLLYKSRFAGNSAVHHPVPDRSAAKSDLAQTKKTVYLYFSDEKNAHLVAEDRTLIVIEDPVEIGYKIIHALIQGPGGNQTRTIPAGTVLNAFYITPDGTAFVDVSDAIRDNHPGGSQTELLTVYSIVNSVVLNIPQVERVKILIEGREAQTLSGHIDVTHPLSADMMLVR